MEKYFSPPSLHFPLTVQNCQVSYTYQCIAVRSINVVKNALNNTVSDTDCKKMLKKSVFWTKFCFCSEQKKMFPFLWPRYLTHDFLHWFWGWRGQGDGVVAVLTLWDWKRKCAKRSCSWFSGWETACQMSPIAKIELLNKLSWHNFSVQAPWIEFRFHGQSSGSMDSVQAPWIEFLFRLYW